MKQASFFWHDYETFGIDPRRHRPAQFAGQRTTTDLEPLGDPVMFYCKPAADMLPDPQSCLITGITPQIAERDGVIEAEFAARIHDEFAQAGTCGVGYNSLRFDDEFTRHLLYRNFYDPYAREWENGNSRWDLIDLVRLCYALRPQGIGWPMRENGAASFRLEDLTTANRLAHSHAHDALADVNATIALAQLLRIRQPRLFEFYFALRRKQRAFELLDYVHRTPVLHVSSRYPAERGCLAIVVPLSVHPSQPNGVIVYDLDVDPAPLIELDAEDIADRLFTPRAELPEDFERVPLKVVHANKSPALAPLSALAGVDTTRIRLDRERCLKHLQLLHNVDGLAEKLRRVFASAHDDGAAIDPELALYRGFPGDADKRLLREVRKSLPEELGSRNFGFRDPRYAELLFRYRARNWPQTLNVEEHTRWENWRHDKLTIPRDITALTLENYLATIAQLRHAASPAPQQQVVLDALEQWGNRIAR